jgi:hypothetical protein
VADDLARQLAALPDHDEAAAQQIGERGRDQEAAALDPDQLVRLVGLDRGFEAIDGLAPGLGVNEQGGDVVEENPRLGEIRHMADMRLQVEFGLHRRA